MEEGITAGLLGNVQYRRAVRHGALHQGREAANRAHDTGFPGSEKRPGISDTVQTAALGQAQHAVARRPRDVGHRATPQRLLILDVLAPSEHLTTDEVHVGDDVMRDLSGVLTERFRFEARIDHLALCGRCEAYARP